MDERLQEGLALITAALAGPSTSSDPSSSTSSRRGGRRGGSCSRALHTLRHIRTDEVKEEQRTNFAPYIVPANRKSTKSKSQSWTVRIVCLSKTDDCCVPCNAGVKEGLLEAGLGEKKVFVPNVDCTPEEFLKIMTTTFPKLDGCGGFELLRCVSNSKQLEVISPKVSQSARLMKSIIGSGRIFVRPIQQDLSLSPDSVDCPSPEWSEHCIKCGAEVDWKLLRKHIEECKGPTEVSDDDSLQELQDEEEWDEMNEDVELPGCQRGNIECDTPKQHSMASGIVHQGGGSSSIAMNCESEMLEPATRRSSSAMNHESESLPEVLRQLGKKVNTDASIRITVRRTAVWTDALHEAQKKSFSPFSLLKVTFFGEPGIDTGGPRREFFRLFPTQAALTLLTGETVKFFNMNVQAFQQRQYYMLGLFTAMSITQGGCGMPILASAVYEYMIQGKCTGVQIAPVDIPLLVLKDAVLKVIAAKCDEDIKAAFNDEISAGLIVECGLTGPLQFKKDELLSILLDYHLMIKAKAAMDQFLDGLKTLGVLEAVRDNPKVFQDFFVYKVVPITGDLLRSVLSVEECRSDTADVKGAKDDAFFHFNLFIDECEDGLTGCTLQDLLAFFTGSVAIPPQGFGKRCTVSFLDKSTSVPSSSTCGLEIRLPICHNDYFQFRESMILALKGCEGFGQL